MISRVLWQKSFELRGANFGGAKFGEPFSKPRKMILGSLELDSSRSSFSNFIFLAIKAKEAIF
jgi:hypothetical protein